MSVERLCPRPDCDASTWIASEQEAMEGVWLWMCADGHHGPRVRSEPGETV